MTGVVPFVYLSTCGCVFSQAGLKAVSTGTLLSDKGKDKDQDQDKDKDRSAIGEEGGAQLDVCPQCAKKFDRLEDVRILNPGPEEEERMRGTMERRRASAIVNKGKSRKRKDAGGTPGGPEAVQPPGKKKKGGSGSGTASPAPTAAPAASRAVASSLAMEEAKRKAQMSDAVKSLYHPKDGKVRKETFMTMGTFTRVSGKCINFENYKTDGIFKLIISMRSCSGSLVSFLENTMMIPRKKPVNLTRRLTTTTPRSFSATVQFQRHVVSALPTIRLLTQSHSPRSTINSRVLSAPHSHPPVLLVHSRRPRSLPLPLQHILLRRHLPPSRMFFSSERLSTAWRHTLMKWNPLPWFVGALLLVVIQYRRYHVEKEVHVDEDGHEVIKLKGPWQVGVPFYSPRVLPIPH